MNSDLTTLPQDGWKYPSFNLQASNVQHQEWKHYMRSSSKSLESPENSTNIRSSLNAVLFFQYIYYATYIVYLEDRTEPIYTSHKYIHAFIYIYIYTLYGNCLTIWMAIAGQSLYTKCWNQSLSSLVYIQKVLLRSQTTHLTNWQKRATQCKPTCKTCITLGEGSCNTRMVKAGGSQVSLERANRNWKARNITKSVVYTHQLIRMIRISIFTLIGNVMKVPDFWIFTIPKTFTDNPSRIIPNSLHTNTGS